MKVSHYEFGFEYDPLPEIVLRATYDILAEKGHLDDIPVDAVQQELQRAHERRKDKGISHIQHLRALAAEELAGETQLHEAKQLLRTLLARQLGDRPLTSRELLRAARPRHALE